MPQPDHLRRMRFWAAAFIAGLVLSGVTAFPHHSELRWLVSCLHAGSLQPMAESTGLLPWIERVYVALSTTNSHYPFLAYGTDWLAFAHVVIAGAFIGPYGDPVRNKWVISFGLVACAGVIPLALIAGSMRGISLPWRLIDCSFGILGHSRCSVSGTKLKVSSWDTSRFTSRSASGESFFRRRGLRFDCACAKMRRS